MGYKVIRIKETVYNQIKEECIKEYLRHHPEMMEIKISFNKILYEISRFYLK